ncbi:hypothetical protein GXW82_14450 [Streptacidiphilus sp. 4-A2]|nr:hypothetical protein [Streptacidiphilus sp. 4-A2]
MSIELPPWLAWVAALAVGQNWPKGDEDGLRALGEAWDSASQQLVDIGEEIGPATQGVLSNIGGSVATEFKSFVEQLQSNLPDMAQAAGQMGTLGKETGVQVEYAKYMILAQLAWLAAEIVDLSWWAPEAVPAAITAARVAVIMILRRLLTSIASGIGFMVGMDALIQAIQMLKGDRTHWDWQSTLSAVESGAISGAIGGVIGEGAGHFAPKFAGNIIGKGIIGGVTGVASSAALTGIFGGSNDFGQAFAGGRSAPCSVAGTRTATVRRCPTSTSPPSRSRTRWTRTSPTTSTSREPSRRRRPVTTSPPAPTSRPRRTSRARRAPGHGGNRPGAALGQRRGQWFGLRLGQRCERRRAGHLGRDFGGGLPPQAPRPAQTSAPTETPGTSEAPEGSGCRTLRAAGEHGRHHRPAGFRDHAQQPAPGHRSQRRAHSACRTHHTRHPDHRSGSTAAPAPAPFEVAPAPRSPQSPHRPRPRARPPAFRTPSRRSRSRRLRNPLPSPRQLPGSGTPLPNRPHHPPPASHPHTKISRITHHNPKYPNHTSHPRQPSQPHMSRSPRRRSQPRLPRPVRR